jgi:hypothetical protein
VVDVSPHGEPLGEPIEDYLDQLQASLRTTPRETRRIIAEAEDHLRQAAAEAQEGGLTRREAEEYAISSFGSVSAVVRAHDHRSSRSLLLAVGRDLTLAGWMLGAVGLVAVGVSGLVAAVMNQVFGREFVGGAPATAGFPASACRHFLAVQPAAHSCAQAAMLENSHDAVSLRLLAGVAGLILLAAYYLASRAGRRSRNALPGSFVPVVAVSVFGAAGLGLVWLASNDAVVGRSAGPGFYLSGAIVALAMAAAYARPLHRSLLRPVR